MSTQDTASSLKTLASHKLEGLTRMESFRADPNLITFEEGFNLREDNAETQATIEQMVLAMQNGASFPAVDVIVKDGIIIARDGHCRTRAAVKVRETNPDFTLECRNFRGNDVDAIFHMIGTGSGGKHLSPLEQGRGYLRLINHGLTAAQIATRLGVSRPTVDNGLVLAEAPAEVQEMVASGDVSGTLAREALKAGPAAVEALKGEVNKVREANATNQEAQPPTADGAAPAKPAKKAKKKKVTAKNLKGTPAEKKARNEHKIACEKAKNTCRHCSKARGKHFAGVYCKKGEPAMFAPQDVPALVLPTEPTPAPAKPLTPAETALINGTGSPDEIAILVRRDQAEMVVTALRTYFKEDADLQAFASTLETCLL